MDSDRACVECFFGRLKRVFMITGDKGFTLSWDKLEDAVTLCVALMNFRHRFRGRALTRAPACFVRHVPVPIPCSTLPPGTEIDEGPTPPVHHADLRVGLTPARARIIAARRVPAEVSDMFEELLLALNDPAFDDAS